MKDKKKKKSQANERKSNKTHVIIIVLLPSMMSRLLFMGLGPCDVPNILSQKC